MNSSWTDAQVFTRVEMLYVNMEINGVPVKAFVDSGAQMSIMTQVKVCMRVFRHVHKGIPQGCVIRLFKS